MGGVTKAIAPFSPGFALIKNKGNVGKAFKDTVNPFSREDKKRKAPSKNGSASGVDPMMGYLSQMQAQQDSQVAQAAEAQRQALLQSQMAAGSQAEQMGESAAQQQLSTMGSMQSIRDANALLAAQQAQATAGQQATGNGFDFNKSREEAKANMFSLPSSSDLKFGGV